MSISSTKLYGSSINKGFGGLVSGLDTDDLVKQMTAGTTKKINREYQAKQKLLYKQEAYREVSSKLLSFSDKYFSYSSGSTSNILSSSFFKSNTIESSSKYVSVSGDADNIKNFSITDISKVATAASFASNKIVSEHTFESSAITDYTSSIAGETMSIVFNEKTYNLTIDKDFGQILKDELDVVRTGDAAKTTLQDVADELNEQLAKITDADGKLINEGNANLKYKLDVTGKKLEFETGTAKLTSASSKILDVLNLETGKVAISTKDVNESSLTRTKAEVFSNTDGYMTFDFNGVQKTIKLDSTLTDEASLKTYLQTELNKAYGSNKVNVVNVGNKLTFEAIGENKSTDLFGVSSISKELRYFTGIEPSTYNRVNQNKAISETNLATELQSADIGDEKTGYAISINGKEFKFEKTATMADIMKKINNDVDAGVKIYFSSTTDTFTVKSTETGSNQGVDIKDVAGKGNLAAALFGSDSVNYTVKPGTDTEMTYTLNGVSTNVTRSTASFSIDGINIDLNEKAAGSIIVGSPITFNVINNSDEVAEKVKQFITDYNEIISLVGGKTSEKPDRDYQPLTPDQSDDMEEDEIKDWNKEAKKGILFGDSKMNNVLYALRGSMAGKTSVSNLVLSDIGISVASMDTSGKLTFNEDTFKSKLAQNGDEIAALFTGSATDTNSVQGIAVQIQSTLKDNVGSYGATGILVDEAGMDNSISSNQNFISERIEEYNDKMVELKKDLKKERERYWSKFTALEKTMSSLNSQSASLTSLLGTN